jgi:glycosyltransferase involved in cell wall biosynthesis
MSENPVRICMLADRHSLYDDRIYWKESLSLKRLGYSVTIILAADSDERGVTTERIHYIKIKKRMFSRFLSVNLFLNLVHPDGLYKRMFREAANLDAAIYHFHDLNVNRVALKLKRLASKPKIIYDVHEPHPENYLDYYHTLFLLRPFKILYSNYIFRWEKKCARQYDKILTTEENLWSRFNAFAGAGKADIIYNYTDLTPAFATSNSAEKIYDAIYCGGITEFRGVIKILEAAKIAVKEKPEIRILFLGSFFPAELKKRMQEFINLNKLENNVILKSAVPYKEVAEYYSKSRIGLGIFLPIRTHKIILQIKIFEYLTFGLPIIGSDFGHIKNYINQHHAGIVVDPENPDEIASALVKLLHDKSFYEEASRNATIAAEKYKWKFMEAKLSKIYQALLDNTTQARNDEC